jgi:hypothetical protein
VHRKAVVHTIVNPYLSDLGEHVLHSPDLALAAETVLAAELELLVEALLLEGASDGSVRLAA